MADVRSDCRAVQIDVRSGQAAWEARPRNAIECACGRVRLIGAKSHQRRTCRSRSAVYDQQIPGGRACRQSASGVDRIQDRINVGNREAATIRSANRREYLNNLLIGELRSYV